MTALQKVLKGLGVEIDFEQVAQFVAEVQQQLPEFARRAAAKLESIDAQLTDIRREQAEQRVMLLELLEGREIGPQLAAILRKDGDNGRTDSTLKRSA